MQSASWIAVVFHEKNGYCSTFNGQRIESVTRWAVCITDWRGFMLPIGFLVMPDWLNQSDYCRTMAAVSMQAPSLRAFPDCQIGQGSLHYRLQPTDW